MRALIVTSDRAAWRAFTDTFAAAGWESVFASGAAEALETIRSGADRPALLLWDKRGNAQSLRDDAVAAMMIDVRIHQSAATALDEEAFHEESEGLGFLPGISAAVTAEDAVKILSSLKKLGIG